MNASPEGFVGEQHRTTVPSKLRAFREKLYDCMGWRVDALFELSDAILEGAPSIRRCI